MTIAELLRRELRRNGARPLLTWYDDEAGARVELSVATTANWVAKLAGLLADEHDVGPGVVVAVDLPLHWQTACLLLAVWSCGGAVAIGSDDGDVRVGGSGDADVPVQPDPMGMSLSRLAAAQPDDFTPVVPVDEGTLALRLAGREWAHGELADAAVEAAGHHGMTGTSRVLTTAGYHTVDGLDAGLLVPLAAGGSVVLVTSADSTRLADRCATENVTHTAGVTVPGLDRLC